ncbi:MAG: M48 family metallopeptidase [Austwickia sp.]|nr:M48 family metallopeptidase [Austwickia sp.]MBK8435946.1 M48 family metallopeptidase [Austwickia sp.]MBK9101630.1 M48 family metallopeptidase [Austwickia sp.]
MPAPRAQAPTTMAPQLPVRIQRSARRRRTVSAIERDGVLVVMLPAGMSPEQERSWVAQMQERWARRRKTGRAAGRRSDQDLLQRAQLLSGQYLGGQARPTSVRWVDNQQRRWGSCTPATGAIRLSTALRPMPAWVQDYVLLHELAHLVVPGHGPSFWRLLVDYPRTERARGYLEGIAAARGLPHHDDTG